MITYQVIYKEFMGHRYQRVQRKCVHILLISPTATFYILYDVDHTQQRMTETWMKVAGEGEERDAARQYRIIHREGCPDGNGEISQHYLVD